MSNTARPSIVIVGAGFGGMAAARALQGGHYAGQQYQLSSVSAASLPGGDCRALASRYRDGEPRAASRAA